MNEVKLRCRIEDEMAKIWQSVMSDRASTIRSASQVSEVQVAYATISRVMCEVKMQNPKVNG